MRPIGVSATRNAHTCCFPKWKCDILVLASQMTARQKRDGMKPKMDVRQGTLALMTLTTLDVPGPQHGYGIARRIEQISDDPPAVNQGTLYPVLLRLDQEGVIAVGPLGKQPPGALLSADACGTQTTGNRKTRLGADSGDGRALL
jgi:hypothetical protein